MTDLPAALEDFEYLNKWYGIESDYRRRVERIRAELQSHAEAAGRIKALDKLVEQAQELDMGYNTQPQEQSAGDTMLKSDIQMIENIVLKEADSYLKNRPDGTPAYAEFIVMAWKNLKADLQPSAQPEKVDVVDKTEGDE